ncbi:MAG: hypothetical protein LBE82_05185, partial [Chitinophagaceae bacterium]|nr:hypothetical protein [Chitinophagaceae bacterium]
ITSRLQIPKSRIHDCKSRTAVIYFFKKNNIFVQIFFMTVSQSLNLYNISLRYFKNEADAKSFVSEIEIILDDKFESKKDTLATKIDLADIRAEMKDQKSEIIKWMFIFWVGQIAILAGIIFAMLNLYFKK